MSMYVCIDIVIVIQMFFETGFTGVVQSHTNISEAELLQYWDWKALGTHQYISMRINPYICIPIHANIIYIDIH
jgi:hypothetical protein